MLESVVYLSWLSVLPISVVCHGLSISVVYQFCLSVLSIVFVWNLKLIISVKREKTKRHFSKIQVKVYVTHTMFIASRLVIDKMVASTTISTGGPKNKK